MIFLNWTNMYLQKLPMSTLYIIYIFTSIAKVVLSTEF